MVLHSLVTLILVLCSAWTVRILRIAGVLRGRTAALIAFALLLYAQTHIVDTDFAEREHILILLLLPYLFASFFQLSASLSLAERISLGFVAGIASCIKPQYALIPIGTDLFLALWYRQLRRLWRPEFLTLILTGLVYIAAIRYITPLYFTQVVPILRDAYPTYRGYHPILPVMLGRIAFDILFSATLLIWIVYRRSLRYPIAPIGLLVASFFATISFGIQQTGWRYQTVPRNVLFLAAAFWLAGEFLAPAIGRLQPNKHLRLLFTIIILLVALPTSLFALKRILHGRNYGPPTTEQRIYATLPPNTTIYVLSTNFYNFSDLVHDHLLWGGRYNHLWMLPAIVFNERAEDGGPPAVFPLPPARVQQLATLVRTNVADDIHTFTPAVIFVEHCSPPTHPCQSLEGLSFNFLAWFQRSPAFAAEWRNYRLQESAEDFDVYARTPETH